MKHIITGSLLGYMMAINKNKTQKQKSYWSY